MMCGLFRYHGMPSQGVLLLWKRMQIERETVERDIAQNMLAKYDYKAFSNDQLNGICYFNSVWN